MGRETKRYEVALVFFFLVFLFSLPVALSPPASAQDEGLIWINKSANQSAYTPGEDILYTIDYGNSDSKNPVQCHRGGYLPRCRDPGSYAARLFRGRNNLTWAIGTLAPEANGRSIFWPNIRRSQVRNSKDLSCLRLWLCQCKEENLYIKKE